jgi:hypothetical protein
MFTAKTIDTYEILRKDKLIITQELFIDLQARLLYQYQQGSKRQKQLRAFQKYQLAVQEGQVLLDAAK